MKVVEKVVKHIREKVWSKIGIKNQSGNSGWEFGKFGLCFRYVIGGIRGDFIIVFYRHGVGERVKNVAGNSKNSKAKRDFLLK